MAGTFQDLINRTRHYLMTGHSDRLNVLGGGITSSDTSVILQQDLKAIADGTRLAVGLEEMHVLSVSGNTAGSSATVIRGFEGSTPAAHALGDVVRVNPQFSDFKIALAINECIEQLAGHGLYRVSSVEFPYQAARSGYDLDVDNLLDVLWVDYDQPGPMRNWPRLMKTDYQINPLPNPTDFPHHQLVLRRGGFPGRTVRVTYKASYSPLVNLNDNVESVAGLITAGQNIPPMGAAIKLLAGREIKRSFLNRQPDTRRPEEVQSGAANQAMQPLVQLYYEAIDTFRLHLKRIYTEQI